MIAGQRQGKWLSRRIAELIPETRESRRGEAVLQMVAIDGEWEERGRGVEAWGRREMADIVIGALKGYTLCARKCLEFL